MKRFTSHIISLGLAYLFLTVGCGVNVTEFCCSLCEKQGIQMFTSSSCEEVHAHHHHDKHAGKHCCEYHHSNQKTIKRLNLASKDKKCELHRLKVEEPTVHGQLVLTHFSFVAIVFMQEPLGLSIETTKPVEFISLKAPPDSGRDILTRISVLTI